MAQNTCEGVRPWGRFEVLADEPEHKIKRLMVEPGQRLSLQRHRYRAEHWYVVCGRAMVTLGQVETPLESGETIDIPRGKWHRLKNRGDDRLVLIEIQTGDYFGEDDIERAADDYGRLRPDEQQAPRPVPG